MEKNVQFELHIGNIFYADGNIPLSAEKVFSNKNEIFFN